MPSKAWRDPPRDSLWESCWLRSGWLARNVGRVGFDARCSVLDSASRGPGCRSRLLSKARHR